jgi:hypothetical protein
MEETAGKGMRRGGEVIPDTDTSDIRKKETRGGERMGWKGRRERVG